MSYAEKVLQPGETILHRSRIHWLIYASSLFWLCCAILVLAAAQMRPDLDWLYYVTLGLAVIAGLRWIAAWTVRATTEIAVTDKRLIYKVGFIRRDTIEMNLHQIESIQVEQSILGRIFNYGTVVVHGTGSGIEPIKRVGSPLALRSFVTAR